MAMAGAFSSGDIGRKKSEKTSENAPKKLKSGIRHAKRDKKRYKRHLMATQKKGEEKKRKEGYESAMGPL